MKLILTLAVTMVALGGCSKYGPESEQAVQATADTAVAPVAQSEELKDNVAVIYNLPRASYSLRCDLNSVGGVGLNPGEAVPLAQASSIVFNGWASTDWGVPPAKIVIVLKGERSFGILAATGAERPDVAEALKSDDAKKAGIAILADTTALVAGTYQVHFYVPDTGAACDTAKLLKVGS